MREGRSASIVGCDMYARAVEEAGARLRDLRREEREDFLLAGAAGAAAVAAAVAHHGLALPLLLGGFAMLGLGVRALWRRWDLVERLSVEPDAFVIAEVFTYASREATAERRRDLAALARRRVSDRSPYDPRIALVAGDLEALALELEDSSLTLDPACAVRCRRLLDDPEESPLFDHTASADDLLATIRRVRVGLGSSSTAAQT